MLWPPRHTVRRLVSLELHPSILEASNTPTTDVATWRRFDEAVRRAVHEVRPTILHVGNASFCLRLLWSLKRTFDPVGLAMAFESLRCARAKPIQSPPYLGCAYIQSVLHSSSASLASCSCSLRSSVSASSFAEKEAEAFAFEPDAADALRGRAMRRFDVLGDAVGRRPRPLSSKLRFRTCTSTRSFSNPTRTLTIGTSQRSAFGFDWIHEVVSKGRWEGVEGRRS